MILIKNTICCKAKLQIIIINLKSFLYKAEGCVHLKPYINNGNFNLHSNILCAGPLYWGHTCIEDEDEFRLDIANCFHRYGFLMKIQDGSRQNVEFLLIRQ